MSAYAAPIRRKEGKSFGRATLTNILIDTNWEGDAVRRLAAENGYALGPNGVFRQRPTPVPTPSPSTASVAPIRPAQRDLIDEGKASSIAKVRAAAERADKALTSLRTLLEETREQEAARAEIARLEAELAEAKAKLKAKPTDAPAQKGGSDAAAIRAWARENSVDCPDRGVLPTRVREAYAAAHGGAA